MGNPQNFSVDVPKRCYTLLENLWPFVSEKSDERLLPLNASFLLAISTPMVNLPIERIWKPQAGRAVGHLNDSVLNESLAKAIKARIGSAKIEKAPFYTSGEWRHHYSPIGTIPPNLSQLGLPIDVHGALQKQLSVDSANALKTAEFCSILRNGLAHGGILYLNRYGHTTEGDPVTKFCFVSTKMNKDKKVVGLHYLQVTMQSYRLFLGKWVGWIQQKAGTNSQLATTRLGHLQYLYSKTQHL
jgi:hypothetical protein